MMAKKLMDYFNKAPRIGTLSTADKTGKVDSAVLGSPRMTDEKTVIAGLGKNRSLINLQQNPHAVFLVMEPGTTLADWKGVRLYLRVKSIATTGPALAAYKAEVAKIAGQQAADMMAAAVTFSVEEIRPLVDMGQGWEKSI
ncbi:MAG TPA: pyridoxamine 5'-phosphate oxidase family protein [Methanoregulaceae archaeon]|nr:pyridoxamine 5'-phosphate oxidase family protein [Methanoregulaceae archaeon]HRY75320.1 pyridoxamine 5'-phosphate oxidase family protein [Methanoregulaceae archaeon]